MPKQKVKNILSTVNKFKDKKDLEDCATYDPISEKRVEYEEGYQVSFVRPEAFKRLDSRQWDIITNHLCEYLDSAAHIGVYYGDVEVSFHSLDKAKANETMETYNQESMLDWEEKKKYPDESERYLIMNQHFDENTELNYDQIIESIL